MKECGRFREHAQLKHQIVQINFESEADRDSQILWRDVRPSDGSRTLARCRRPFPPRERLQIQIAKVERDRALLASENASHQNANRLLRLEITSLGASNSKLARAFCAVQRGLGECSPHAAR
jgi:hypothetical protein